MNKMKNPFFIEINEIIDFNKLKKEHITQATEIAILDAKIDLEEIFNIENDKRTFENTMRALDDII